MGGHLRVRPFEDPFPGNGLFAITKVFLHIVFITHAGQSSFQETLCHQKPVVAIPVSGDQPINGREVERLGFGKSISFSELKVIWKKKLYITMGLLL